MATLVDIVIWFAERVHEPRTQGMVMRNSKAKLWQLEELTKMGILNKTIYSGEEPKYSLRFWKRYQKRRAA